MNRPVESVGSTAIIATTTVAAWLVDVNWGAVLTAGAFAGATVIGLLVRYRRETGLAAAEVVKANAEAAKSAAEAEKAKAEADKVVAEADRMKLDLEFERKRKEVEHERERQAMMAGTLTGEMKSLQRSLDDALKQLSTANSALTLREQENQALHSMLDQLKKEIKTEVAEEQKVLRHNVVDRVSGQISKVQADAMEKDQVIARLQRELEKTKRVINNNADVTEKIAADSGSQEIKVAHIEDTSMDMKQLKD